MSHSQIYAAARNGDDARLRDLLAAAPTRRTSAVDNLNVDGFTPLHAACAFGHVSCVQLLLEHGAVANRRGMARNTQTSHFRRPVSPPKQTGSYLAQSTHIWPNPGGLTCASRLSLRQTAAPPSTTRRASAALKFSSSSWEPRGSILRGGTAAGALRST